ncbi:MAG: hypothetical protein M1830_005417 [Pleopsidium flavum]|nr:MAG: hypothetical protein M1830_005417 [Pleopsidium flavum]
MADEHSSAGAATLQPPRKSVELEDPGAHELVESENEDDHFSDASEGHKPASPIPMTRIEKVDDVPSLGQVPGTAAYETRSQDAVPDDVEMIPEGAHSRRNSRGGSKDRSPTPGGAPIPQTVVEKVDPALPIRSDIPGTAAHEPYKADAVPDVVLQAPENARNPSKTSLSRPGGTPGDLPIPTTVVSKVDTEPSYGEVPGTDAYDMRKGDAEPDIVEEKGDIPGMMLLTSSSASSERLTESESPTSSIHRSEYRSQARRKRSVGGSPAIADDGGFGPMHYHETTAREANADDGFGDDFDDFEQGEGNEEFGDFDDGLKQPAEVDTEHHQISKDAGIAQSLPSSIPSFPVLDYSEFNTLNNLQAATSPYLHDLFPRAVQEISPRVDDIPDQNSIFLTERSLSLWSQLVAPPPLQPPNWVRSRIRRLFLVSLGVPVDLDEILPASKQKKLILPSVHLRGDSRSPRPSLDGRPNGSVARLKQENGSSASVDSISSTRGNRRRRGPPPAPELDLGATRTICTVTDAALSSFTDEELKAHILKLQQLTKRASEVLEYWLKRKDGALGNKEAFEGVIENLVKHARKVRK